MSARTDGDVRPTVYTVPPHEPFVDALRVASCRAGPCRSTPAIRWR